MWPVKIRTQADSMRWTVLAMHLNICKIRMRSPIVTPSASIFPTVQSVHKRGPMLCIRSRFIIYWNFIFLDAIFNIHKAHGEPWATQWVVIEANVVCFKNSSCENFSLSGIANISCRMLTECARPASTAVRRHSMSVQWPVECWTVYEIFIFNSKSLSRRQYNDNVITRWVIALGTTWRASNRKFIFVTRIQIMRCIEHWHSQSISSSV